MAEELSAEDRDLVNYIIEHVEREGFPPSRRQIAEHFDKTSANTGQKRLERLVKAGVIQRAAGVPRGIKINRERLAEFGND